MWFLVDKGSTAVPTTGTYKSWKRELREEGRYQCVYCAISESLFGGERNFHVEHYRPKKTFSSLTNSFANLFYSCAICNSFKGSDWPGNAAPDLSNKAYPDPSIIDYATFLFVEPDGTVESATHAGRYMIERLNLNRAQLRMIRRFTIVRDEIGALLQQLDSALKGCQDPGVLREAFRCAKDAYTVLDRFTRANPYEPADARR